MLKKWSRIVGAGFVGILLIAGIGTYFTNPFNVHTLSLNPFRTHIVDGSVLIEQQHRLTSHEILSPLGYVKSAFHILAARMKNYSYHTSSSINDAIDSTSKERFDARYPYVITGGHFSVLYPRNLGVFYHTILDHHGNPSIQLQQDRDQIALRTIGYALEAYRACGKLTTTIVPLGGTEVTCIDIYHFPSDALHGILYTLALSEKKVDFSRYFKSAGGNTSSTLTAAIKLQKNYESTLSFLVDDYERHVWDKKNNEVYKDRHFSSAKDVTERSGAFYDNVILWNTIRLSRLLGIRSKTEEIETDMKKRILETYWDKDANIFKEDFAQNDSHISADILIVLSTGFLDPSDSDDYKYLRKLRESMEKSLSDKSYPIPYQTASEQATVPIVQLAASDYQTTAVWPYWGIEYCKLLTLTSENLSDLEKARTCVSSIERLVLRYEGLPEAIRSDGTLYRSLLYQTIPKTGWIIDLIQAKEVFKAKRATFK